MTISIDGGLFMLEYPEVLTISEQLRNGIAGSVASRVLPPSKAHKFCWFNGDPAGYDAALRGVRAATAEGFGFLSKSPLITATGYALMTALTSGLCRP